MGKNVRRKKGRPPKASAREKSETERGLRRSIRRRNVKYVFDLDDYFDDDQVFDGDDDHRRKAKKLKLLLNLECGGKVESKAPGRSWRRRVDHAPNYSVSLSKNGGKPSKILKICNEIDEDTNDDVSDGDGKKNGAEFREKKPEAIAEDSPPGTPTEAPSGLPLPDKKALEMILYKLQKKDVYGVYAEPVDPEELPDYHDVIKHPMDFGTVRSKLQNGLYKTMEQFEYDVFLICSNAMQYNEPDTIYHKQACSIKELAIKKFHKIRLKAECSEKNVQPEQEMRYTVAMKKSVETRSMSQTLQRNLGTDFSYGATLSTAVDIHRLPNVLQGVRCERHGNGNGNGNVLVVGNPFLIDNIGQEEESLTGKAPHSKLGANLTVQNENCRATYIPFLAHPEDRSEPVFSTFDGESKQLVPVGLYSDNSYARSLARFAATLGSVVWKFTSKKMEQALPQGVKFGRGWVGEYEPPPPPVLLLDNCPVKEPPFFAKVQPDTDRRKVETVPIITFSSKEPQGTRHVLRDKKPFFIPPAITPPVPSIIPSLAVKDTRRRSVSETPSLFLSPGMKPRGSDVSDKKIFKQFELTGLAASHKNAAQLKHRSQVFRGITIEASVSDLTSRNIHFSPSETYKQPGLSTIPSSDPEKAESYKPHDHRQGLSNPVQAQNQQIPLSQSSIDASPLVLSSASSSISNDLNPAALYTAQVWMSAGAGNIAPAEGNINPTSNVQPQVAQNRGDFPCSGQMHVQQDRISSPVHAFVPQGLVPVTAGNEIQFCNQPMVYPRLVSADLSKFALQSAWWNLSSNVNVDYQSLVSPRIWKALVMRST